MAPPRRIAAIDIGSNSVRQIVADVTSDGVITVVDEMKEAPRLGADLDGSGQLGDAIDGARRPGDRADGNARAPARCDARRGGRHERRARRLECRRVHRARSAEADLQVRVIDGEDEARLSYLSALAHFDLGAGRTVVMDIGGGSLELALAADGVLDDLTSLPFGALRLTERYLRDGLAAKRSGSCEGSPLAR